MRTNWRTEWKPLAAILAVFLGCFYLPIGTGRFDNAVRVSLELAKWYAREHVVLCLVPAFFIAGAIGVFVSQASAMKFLGPKANRTLASVQGTILAVCSCTVLPLFAGIWRMGAGLGPAPVVAGSMGLSVITSTSDGEPGDWFSSTWTFAKQILPLLFFGVLVAGLLLGRPGNEGLIPNAWVTKLVGGNSLWSNFFASIVGAFMYFATLTEVPILQGLLGSGMGKGPALALLLAGPALSLPSMLVLRSIMGTHKTVVYVTLVVVMATITGMIYGAWF